MARTFRTLSLSLPPGVMEELARIGKKSGRTGARVAAGFVLDRIAKAPRKPHGQGRQMSWCCNVEIDQFKGPLVITNDGRDRWMHVVVLVCSNCGGQMHGSEYQGWLEDPGEDEK